MAALFLIIAVTVFPCTLLHPVYPVDATLIATVTAFLMCDINWRASWLMTAVHGVTWLLIAAMIVLKIANDVFSNVAMLPGYYADRSWIDSLFTRSTGALACSRACPKK